MDRAGRRFTIVSQFFAVPMVLLMASNSYAETTRPDAKQVRHAAPTPSDGVRTEHSPIQQVAGKQPVTQKTRPGLFEVLAGSAPKGNQNHNHKNMGQSQSRGLLDGVFGRNSSPINRQNPNQARSSSSKRSSPPSQRSSSASKRSSSASKRSTASSKSSASRTNQQAQRTPAEVNWDGIPYHSPTKSKGKQARIPVQDPSSRAIANRSSGQTGTTRIIRGGSAKVTKALPASSRKSATQPQDRPDPLAASLPKPPAEIGTESQPSARSSSPRISSTSSSRRSGRRDLTALEASVARRSKAPAAKQIPKSESAEVELIPRVVPKSKSKSTAEAEKQSKPAVEANSASEDKVAKTAPDPATKRQETKAPSASLSPAPNTAQAAIGLPEAGSKSSPNAAAVAKDAPSSASPRGDYTIPVDPESEAASASDLLNQPYAASTPKLSTPASAASHRSGPPMSAFKSAPPALYSGPNAINAPIGSGVVPPQPIVASDQGSPSAASQPAYQTARLPGSANDPYGSHTHSPSNRMSTTGQPVQDGSTASSSNTGTNSAARSYVNGRSVPMHSIPGHQANAPGPLTHDTIVSADDFDRSTYETRNQMRGKTRESGLPSRSGSTATTSELPGIRVVTHGPSSIMIRQTSQFEIRVENRGAIDAEGVLVRSTVPDWADLGGQNASAGNVAVREQGSGRQLVWTIDHLPAGTSERMFVRLTAARSGNYDLDVDWTLLPQKAVAKVQVHEPRLDLTIEGPDEVIYGQSQTYKVHVLNPGDGTAPNVVFTLSPNSATPQTQRIGDIPPGKEAQFDVELTAQDLGDLKIHGLATGELDLRAEADKTIRVSAAQLEAMLNGPELKYQDSEAVYKLQVRNTGSVASEKIMATLRLPAGVEYIDGIDGVSPQGSMLRWEITALPPGATRNYQFRCQMTSTGEHMFSFDCKGTAAGNAAVSLATEVESIADLVLTVNDPTAPAPIGSDVTYEIVIRNRGSKEATDVRAVAQFSHGIEPHRIEGQSGEVVTGQVLFDPIGRIGAGQEVRLRVIAKAETGGHHRFRSEVRSGDTVLVAEEATHYMSPRSERVSRHSNESSAR